MAKIYSLVVVGLGFLNSANLLADNHPKPNLLKETCSNASSLAIRMVNENGKCDAHWKCDGKEFKVLCETGKCKCYSDQTATFLQTTYTSCDSDILQECYAQ